MFPYKRSITLLRHTDYCNILKNEGYKPNSLLISLSYNSAFAEKAGVEPAPS